MGFQDQDVAVSRPLHAPAQEIDGPEAVPEGVVHRLAAHGGREGVHHGEAVRVAQVPPHDGLHRSGHRLSAEAALEGLDRQPRGAHHVVGEAEGDAGELVLGRSRPRRGGEGGQGQGQGTEGAASREGTGGHGRGGRGGGAGGDHWPIPRGLKVNWMGSTS